MKIVEWVIFDKKGEKKRAKAIVQNPEYSEMDKLRELIRAFNISITEAKIVIKNLSNDGNIDA